MRILNIAAFAVSGYASTEGRQCKPFNPLLGETYEADYPDKGVRFFSEKVFLFSCLKSFILKIDLLLCLVRVSLEHCPHGNALQFVDRDHMKYSFFLAVIYSC